MAEQKSYYEIDGKQYPRVTHVLGVIEKPGISRWRGRVGNTEADRISREASDLGAKFHETVSEINRGEHLKNFWRPPEGLQEMAEEYIRWMHQDVEEILGIEELVYSDEEEYAGTMDLYARIRGDDLPSIIDIKTGNSISADWPLQLSAYRKAAFERGRPSKRRIVIRIPKIGKIKVERYEYKEHERDEAIWSNTLKIWHWLQEDKKRAKDALVISGF